MNGEQETSEKSKFIVSNLDNVYEILTTMKAVRKDIENSRSDLERIRVAGIRVMHSLELMELTAKGLK
jgi:hypothetical protein